MGVLCSVVLALDQKRVVDNQFDHHSQERSSDIRDHIIARFNEHVSLLLSGAALFDASGVVTREQWRVFQQRLNLNNRLPGIQGVGFSLLIPSADLERHITQIRSEGFPEYTVWPGGERAIYTSSIYLEPFTDRNLRAFGFDMFLEPIRRHAMEMARDTGNWALSGKVTLVQEKGEDVQAGVLLFFPVYRKGMPVDSIEGRRAAMSGWVYSPYRMKDLMRGILAEFNLENDSLFRLQVFEGDAPVSQNLLYETAPDGKASVRWSNLMPVDFNGRHWTLRFSASSSGWMDSEYFLVWIVLAVGLVLTALLWVLTYILLSTRSEAQRLAEILTVDLRKKTAMLQAVIDSTIDGILLVSPERKRVLINKRMFELFNIPLTLIDTEDDGPLLEHVVGLSMDPVSFQERVEYLFAHQDVIAQDELHFRNGMVLDRYTAPVLSRAGQYFGRVWLFRDITRRKRDEEAFRQVSKRMDLVIRKHGFGVWEDDLVRHNLVWDEQMFKLYGIDPVASVSYKFWLSLLHPEDRSRCDEDIRKALLGEKDYDVKFRVIWPDGSVHCLHANALVEFDAGGKPLRMVGTKRDITEGTILEESVNTMRAQLIQADKLATLGEMATGMAHEINQPLNAIALISTAFRKYMQKKMLTDEKLTEGLRDIDAMVKRMSRTVAHVRSLARQDFADLEMVDCTATVNDACALMSKQMRMHEIEVSLDSEPGLPRIKGKPHQLEQVWINFIANACDAMDEKQEKVAQGVLNFPGYRKMLRITLSHDKESNVVLAVFSDNGIGLTGEQASKVFEPFFTTKEVGKGSGLGLAISRGIVQNHQGRIEIEGRPGEGAILKVYLPVTSIDRSHGTAPGGKILSQPLA